MNIEKIENSIYTIELLSDYYDFQEVADDEQ